MNRGVSSDLVAPAIVFLVALAIRSAYFAQAGDDPLFSVLLGDGFVYDGWARQIAAGNWLGSDVFYQAPLYPYLVAGLHKLSGGDAWVVRWLQASLGALACVLVAVVGRRLFSPPAGLIAGLMLAIYPPAIFFDGLIQKTAVGLFLMALWLALLAPGEPSQKGRRALAAGLVLGCLALIRENALVLVPIGAVWLASRAANERRVALRVVVLFLCGFAAALAPVVLRNLAVSGDLVLTTSQSGPNFYIGNHAGANGKYVPLAPDRGDAQVERADAVALAEAAAGRKLGPGEVSRYWWSLAGDWIRAEPAAWARLMVKKWWLVWHAGEIVDADSIEAYAEASPVLRRLYRLWHFGVLLPLAVVGMWLTRARWRELWFLYAVLGAIASSVTLFYVLARYRFPLVPTLALFAGVAVTKGWQGLRERRWREMGAVLAIAVMVALAANWPLAVEADPRATTYLNLGLALTDVERYEEALAALDRARLAADSFAPIHLARAAALSGVGRTQEAERSLRRALELAPGGLAAHRALAGLLVERGDLVAARRHFDAVLRGAPQDIPALLGVAQASTLAGDLATARQHLERALRADPRSALAHGLMANLLAHEGDLSAAREHYERALVLAPAFADARFKLGVVLLDLGRPAEAVEHLRAAVSLLPEYAAAHDALARALAATAAGESRPAPGVSSPPEPQ